MFHKTCETLFCDTNKELCIFYVLVQILLRWGESYH